MASDARHPPELGASGGSKIQQPAKAWALALLEASKDPVLVVGQDRRIAAANARAESVLGYDAEAFLERPVEDMVQPEDRRLCLHLVSQHLETAVSRAERSPGEQLVCRTATGEELPSLWSLTPFRSDGDPFVVVTIQPASTTGLGSTDRARQEALEQAHEQIKYQATLLESQNESSIDGILIVDNESRIVSSNRRFLEIWDLNPGLLNIGDTDEDALSTALDKIENVSSFLERVEWLHHHPEATLRDEVHLVDGRVLERWTTPVKSSDGTLYGRGWYFRDITDRKQVEAELRMHREELEERVAERTAELTETTERLRREVEQRKRAEAELEARVLDLARSNEELERFAYVASHDLQEPLRMVASYVQLLARRYEGALDEEADEYITYAVEGATRMQGLIRDVLAYSQLGAQRSMDEDVDMDALLRGRLHDLQETIERVRAEITADPLPVVQGNRSELGQVLDNLLRNALKFHGDAPPRIHVSVREEPDRWVFTVQDAGIGIDPDYHDKIFEMFQRLHARGAYPGTGIGLAICKKIMERHGGSIWVESALGEGSTFSFSLPRASA